MCAISLTDVMHQLRFPENGQSRKRIRELCEQFGVDISMLSPTRKNTLRPKYPIVSKVCPVCQTKFTARSGHPREKSCCSYSCANKHFRGTKSEEIRKKISDGVNKYLIVSGRKTTKEFVSTKKVKFLCPECGVEKMVEYRKNRLTCSPSCLRKYQPYRDMLRDRMLIRVKNGTHSGWKSRTGKAPSYAERFFMKVLTNNGVQYKRDLPVGRWFIDFAIENRRIALEIDGKQHEWPERKIKDAEKDKYLTEIGWRVHRIKWKSINTSSGKEYIRNEISRFLEIYRNVA